MADWSNKKSPIQKSNNSLITVSYQISVVDKIISSSHIEKQKLYWRQKLDSLKEEKKWNKLISESENCIENFPEWEYGYFRRATSKYNYKDYQGALADTNTAIEINDRFSAAFKNRGLIREELNDDLGAIEDFTKVIELNSDEWWAYLKRGLVKEHLKKYEESCLDFLEAIKLRALDPHPYFWLSVCKFQMDDIIGAIKVMDKVLSIPSEDWIASENMLRICYEWRSQLKGMSGDKEGEILDTIKVRALAKMVDEKELILESDPRFKIF